MAARNSAAFFIVYLTRQTGMPFSRTGFSLSGFRFRDTRMNSKEDKLKPVLLVSLLSIREAGRCDNGHKPW